MKDGKELKAENCSEAVEMSLISACEFVLDKTTVSLNLFKSKFKIAPL